jgi:Rieske Fe-S protein
MTEIVHEEQKISHDDRREVSRRWLLLAIGALFNGVVGIAIAIPVVRYLLGPIRRQGAYDSWISLGAVNDFPIGETRLATYENPYSQPWDGATDKTACWVRHISDLTFQVFAINCAHLGCPVRWFPQSKLFMCPCHGGVYYADGSRASGPPERGLFEYDYKIVNNELRVSAGQTPTLSNHASLRVLNNSGCKGCTPCAG